jgi:hypothetical protein
MSHRRARIAAAAASVVLAALALAACAPDPQAAPPAATRTAATPTPTPIPTQSPGATPAAHVVLPTDCKQILTAAVLTELGKIPLNDPVYGPSGVQDDGSLICIWGDPAADTTNLRTKISAMSRGPALELLNGLDGTHHFTCYTPDGGTRCEASWKDPHYPVTDGRTVFWRDGILIDTSYSNLAPKGYTAAIIAAVYG